MDWAYDVFAQYVQHSAERVLQEQGIDFRDVYGPDWLRRSGGLFRYFVKHVCCRLAESGIEVEQPLIDFLDARAPCAMIDLQYGIRLDVLAMMKQSGDAWWLAVGDVACNLSANDPDRLYDVFSHYDYGWLRVEWRYSPELPAWTELPQKVTLTAGYNVDPAHLDD